MGILFLLLYYSISKFSKGLLKSNKNLKLWTGVISCVTIIVRREMVL